MSIHNLAGQVLGQYELRELLGVGGMGAVYRGYQITLKRAVAVKILPPGLAEKAGYIERFNREARIAASLEHANIIRIYDYGTQQNISYLVMQLLTGGTLAERLEQRAGTEKPLPSLGEISDLLNQLASGLDYAHSQGVIHRDIKPSNVMFDSHGNACLLDFGIAKLMEATTGSLTTQGMVLGTWAYMAPEQWRADELTPATDQYALGVMVYALIAGRMPFEAPTPPGMMHKHLTEMPTPIHTRRPGTSPKLSLVLERALAKKMNDRFPTTTAFAQAFGAAIGENTGAHTRFFTGVYAPKPAPAAVLTPSAAFYPATPAPPVSASTTSVYRHPLTWGLAAVSTILVLILLIMLLRGGGSGDKKTTPPPVVVTATASGAPQVITVLTTNTPTLDEQAAAVPLPTLLDEGATETIQAVIAQHLTETAAAPTPTLLDEGATETIQAVIAQHLTETAAAPLVLITTMTSEPTTEPVLTNNPSLIVTFAPTASFTPTATLTPVPTETAALPAATLPPVPTETAAPPTFTPTNGPTDTATHQTTGTTNTVVASPTATLTPCQVADLNRNGKVDIFDIRLIAGAYGSQNGEAPYVAAYDFDSDGSIDILDLRRVSGQYGQACP